MCVRIAVAWVWRSSKSSGKWTPVRRHTGSGADTPREGKRWAEASAWRCLAWFLVLGPDPPVFTMWASSLVTAAEALSPHRFSEKTRKEYELPTMRSETVQVVGW